MRALKPRHDRGQPACSKPVATLAPVGCAPRWIAWDLSDDLVVRILIDESQPGAGEGGDVQAEPNRALRRSREVASVGSVAAAAQDNSAVLRPSAKPDRSRTRTRNPSATSRLSIRYAEVDGTPAGRCHQRRRRCSGFHDRGVHPPSSACLAATLSIRRSDACTGLLGRSQVAGAVVLWRIDAYQPRLEGDYHELGAVLDAQFRHGALDVGADSQRADITSSRRSPHWTGLGRPW